MDEKKETAVSKQLKEKKPGITKILPFEKIKDKKKANIIVAAVTAALLLCSIPLISGGVNAGAKSLADSFSDAYSSEKEATRKRFYDSAYEKAEKNYHVSNTAVISIGDIENVQRLEVLKANDVEFITEDRDSNSGNVTAWLEVNGEGTFVVNLEAAEFIIDNERHYVLVRVPKPELINITIKDTTRKLFCDDVFDGSFSEGVDLALKQRNEAILQIQKSLLSNQYIYSSAKDIASGMLQNMVKQFNPEISDLTVEVEFME